MKKLYPRLLFAVVMLLCALPQLIAQSNVVIYTEAGEVMQVRINNELVNATPTSQVRLDGLPDGLHKATITVFTAGNNSVMLKRNFFIESGYEFYFNVKQNDKGMFVCNNSNVVPLSSLPNLAPPNQVVTLPQNPNTLNPLDPSINPNFTQPSVAPGTNVNVNINLGELFGFGVNPNFPQPHNPNFPQPAPAPKPNVPVYTGPPVYVPGYTGGIGCPAPISDMEFAPLRSSVQKGSFESTRTTLAKNMMQGRCFTTSQIRSLIGLFDFESSRLDIAKYAYDYVYDKGNYYLINDIFSFESSVTDLSNFVAKKGQGTPQQQWNPQPGNPWNPQQPQPNNPWNPQPNNPWNPQPNNPNNPFNPVPGYTGPIGCQNVMSPMEFDQIINNIKSKSFESTKVTLAKQIFAGKCMTAQQARSLTQIFTFESSKLDIAKFAYDYTYDKGNYYVVNDVMSFDSSVVELSNYVKNR